MGKAPRESAYGEEQSERPALLAVETGIPVGAVEAAAEITAESRVTEKGVKA